MRIEEGGSRCLRQNLRPEEEDDDVAWHMGPTHQRGREKRKVPVWRSGPRLLSVTGSKGSPSPFLFFLLLTFFFLFCFLFLSYLFQQHVFITKQDV
jgi:hypothetical protein